jgi:hypothetical protein
MPSPPKGQIGKASKAKNRKATEERTERQWADMSRVIAVTNERGSRLRLLVLLTQLISIIRFVCKSQATN